MTLILVYTLSKTILGHSFFNYILVQYKYFYLYILCEIEPTNKNDLKRKRLAKSKWRQIHLVRIQLIRISGNKHCKFSKMFLLSHLKVL